jgi:hypothetical protein
MNDANTPSPDEYGDMNIDERPEDDDEEAIDKYLNVELIMNMGTNDERRGRVVKRSRGLDGDPIGRAHVNPLFDTREYEVEFTDGTHERYQANVIAENMYAQVDDEGNEYLLLSEITDHKSDGSAVQIADGMTRSANGQEKPKVTTRGWHLHLNTQKPGLPENMFFFFIFNNFFFVNLNWYLVFTCTVQNNLLLVLSPSSLCIITFLIYYLIHLYLIYMCLHTELLS